MVYAIGLFFSVSFCLIRISSFGGGRIEYAAFAIIDFPMPGGPQSNTCLLCWTAERTSLTACSWPTTLSKEFLGTFTSSVVFSVSRTFVKSGNLLHVLSRCLTEIILCIMYAALASEWKTAFEEIKKKKGEKPLSSTF